MRFILLLFSLNCVASAAEQPYISLLAQTGVTLMMSSFSNDLPDAADRYAQRCDATPAELPLPPEKLNSAVGAEFEQTAQLAEVQSLVSWYKSPTGRKVTLLEQRDITENELEQFQPVAARTEQVIRIYENTRAGLISTSVAVELEYAGWLASGCIEKVRSGGDKDQILAEKIYGKVIRDQGEMLETLFRPDTIKTMEFVLSSLSMSELIEYADVTYRSRAVYTGLVRSLKNAIEKEVKRLVGVP